MERITIRTISFALACFLILVFGNLIFFPNNNVEAATTPNITIIGKTSNPTYSDVFLSWTKSQDACFSKYDVEVSIGSVNSWGQANGLPITNINQNSFDVYRYKPGNTWFNLVSFVGYDFRVFDRDCIGSASDTKYNVLTASVPTLTLTPLSTSSIKIDWTSTNSYGSANGNSFSFHSFKVHRSTGGAWSVIKTSPWQSTRTYTDTGLSPYTKYYYLVYEVGRFTEASGATRDYNSFTNEKDATTLDTPPSTPGTPTEGSPDQDYDTDGGYTIHWSSSSDPESSISAYDIQERIDSGGWNSIGTTSGSSYSRNTGSGGNGHVYSYKVRAKNGAGVWGSYSNPSDGITIDMSDPSISISSPVNNEIFSTNSITVSGSASDNVGLNKVEIQVNGGPSWLTASGTTSWSKSITLDPGTNTITAKATDKVGRVKTTSSISLTYDSSDPTITIASPTDNQIFATDSITISGSASDNLGLNKVEVQLNSGPSWLTASGTTSWSKLITLDPGTNAIAARATDVAERVKMTSSISVTYDSSDPTITISSPTDNQIFATDSITVSGSASDNLGLNKVEVRVNSGPSWLTASGTTSWSKSITLDSGANTITARATDVAGRIKMTSSISLTYDSSDPTITISSPIDNDIFTTDSITISGSASDNLGLNKVEVQLNDEPSWWVASGTTSWSKSITLDSGTNTITARATDNAGRIKITSLDVIFDSEDPTITISSPTDNQIFASESLTISGSASDNIGLNKIEVELDASSWNTATGTTSWSKTVKLKTGTNIITVRATDNAGRTKTASTNVVYDSDCPSITHTKVISGITNHPLTITALVTDTYSGVDSVNLYYKKSTGSSYSIVAMTSEGGDTYSANIPASAITEDEISYYIKVTDKVGNVGYYGNSGLTKTEPTSSTDIDVIITTDDSDPPTITHEKVHTSVVGTSITITAFVTDPSGVDSATLYYKKLEDSSFSSAIMNGNGDTYTATIPAIMIMEEGVMYYMRATDEKENIGYFGNSGSTHMEPTTSAIKITITEKPSQLDHMEITPSSATLSLNKEDGNNQKQFSAWGYDANNKVISGLTFTWTVKGGIGTINENNGFFTAIKEGTGKVIVTVTYNGVTKLGEAAVTVLAENVDIPTCKITSLNSGETVSGTISISGIASIKDSSITKVEMRIDRGAWQIASETTSWEYSWDTTQVSDGTHNIYARAFDGKYISNEAIINVVVDNGNDGEDDDVEGKNDIIPRDTIPENGRNEGNKYLGISSIEFGIVIVVILFLVFFISFFIIRKRRGKRRLKENREWDIDQTDSSSYRKNTIDFLEIEDKTEKEDNGENLEDYPYESQRNKKEKKRQVTRPLGMLVPIKNEKSFERNSFREKDKHINRLKRYYDRDEGADDAEIVWDVDCQKSKDHFKEILDEIDEDIPILLPIKEDDPKYNNINKERKRPVMRPLGNFGNENKDKKVSRYYLNENEPEKESSKQYNSLDEGVDDVEIVWDDDYFRLY